MLNTSTKFPDVGQKVADEVGRVPEEVEIRRVVFSMGSFKAPGIDGFPPIFYKNNWESVGPTLVSFVKGVFRGEMSLEEANRALISLIPKKENPEKVGHFRPISLCTVHYKCIMKIIAGHLKRVMNDLITPFQSSFIVGRHIQDNLIIGQEMLHIINKNKSKKGIMALKIDMEKAYDRISWDFLKQVLTEVGLNMGYINLILACVSSVSYNVMWNGSLTEFFSPCRGLRQGDPISLLLCVMYGQVITSYLQCGGSRVLEGHPYFKFRFGNLPFVVRG